MGQAVTYSALIKLVRLVNGDTLGDINDGKIPADRYCQRGGLRLLKTEGVPLIVDHDMGRKVGVVHGLLEFDDVDGPWAWARAEITDPPHWVKQGTSCSYGSFPVHRSNHGWTHRSIVAEVSLLTSSQTPVEPRAHVAVLRRTSLPSTAAPREIRLPPGTVIRRPVGQVLGVR